MSQPGIPRPGPLSYRGGVCPQFPGVRLHRDVSTGMASLGYQPPLLEEEVAVHSVEAILRCCRAVWCQVLNVCPIFYVSAEKCFSDLVLPSPPPHVSLTAVWLTLSRFWTSDMDVVFSSWLTGRGMAPRSSCRSTGGAGEGGGTVLILCLVCFVFLLCLSARGSG